MVALTSLRKTFYIIAIVMVVLGCFAPMAMAQEHADGVTTGTTTGEGIKVAGVAIGAGLALLGGALGTGRAQAGIGAGGTGALAEKPELFTNILILVALPETI